MRTNEIQPRANTLNFDISDVTGMHTHRSRQIQPSSPAGSVAQLIATRMSLPENVPWTLRNNRTGAFLDDELPIGDQVADEEQLAVVPKAHLG